MPETLDITPSPRVLRMLGQIDFAPWQCLAELIDNSIDSFLENFREGTPISRPRITVSVPSDADLRSGTGAIEVRDNGRGMTREQLANAVKAGYSGNDPVEKMGLFGMGFNISTARLGSCTEVWTTSSDSPTWIGVKIDFQELEGNRTFHAPLLSREKDTHELETQCHGTVVRITKLGRERMGPLIRGAGKAHTRKRLGKVYGRVMQETDLQIIYDGDLIKPRRHCIWSEQRSVPNAEFGNVPARLEINEALSPRSFCRTCWVWLQERDTSCPACGSAEGLIERKRTVKGWIGVQRYFDKEHYGIDLVRNGRVIESLDKSLFYFITADGDHDLEYPVDAIHWGGRIVGELEIDFVRVSHQKDSFDKLDPEWKLVRDIVRGTSPLRPQIAKRGGMPVNRSPLARLYAGYKAGHAGLRELVPGTADGKGLNTGAVRDWVELFHDGDSAYQADDKWYELVLQAERALRGESSTSTSAAGEIPLPTTTDNSGPSSDRSGAEDGLPLPVRQQEEAAAKQTTEPSIEEDPLLSKIYELGFDSGKVAIRVTANRTSSSRLGGKPFVVDASGFSFRFEYDPQHAHFEESTRVPLDVLLIDLAQHFLAVSAGTPRSYPVSMIERDLRLKYHPDTLDDIGSASDSAEALLSELKRFLDETLPTHAPFEPGLLSEEVFQDIRKKALRADLSSDEKVREIVANGEFVKYLEFEGVLSLVAVKPKLVTDGRFFSNPYESLAEDLRPDSLSMLVNAMEDVRWLTQEGSGAVSKDLAWRLRFARALASQRLIQSWRT